MKLSVSVPLIFGFDQSRRLMVQSDITVIRARSYTNLTKEILSITGCIFSRSSDLKVKVKFQIAPIRLKLGESNPDNNGVYFSRSSDLKFKVKFQIASFRLKLGKNNVEYRVVYFSRSSNLKFKVKF